VAEVAEIVADVRARGDAALREWSLRLDGVEPACAIPAGDLPEQALHDLADRVRRWHEAQRPPDVLSRSSRAWSSSAAGFRSRRSGSTSRAH
jgi:histidinol dehydrogenase